MSQTIAAPPTIMDGVAHPTRTLIGRDAELEELSSLLGVAVVARAARAARDGEGRHVLLAGAKRLFHGGVDVVHGGIRHGVAARRDTVAMDHQQ